MHSSDTRTNQRSLSVSEVTSQSPPPNPTPLSETAAFTSLPNLGFPNGIIQCIGTEGTLNGLSSANRLETTFTTAGPLRPGRRRTGLVRWAGGGGGPPGQSPTPVGGFWACFRTAVMHPRDRAPRGPEALHLLTAVDTPGPKRCWAPSNMLPPGKGTSARRPLMEVLAERAVRRLSGKPPGSAGTGAAHRLQPPAQTGPRREGLLRGCRGPSSKRKDTELEKPLERGKSGLVVRRDGDVEDGPREARRSSSPWLPFRRRTPAPTEGSRQHSGRGRPCPRRCRAGGRRGARGRRPGRRGTDPSKVTLLGSYYFFKQF